MADVIHSLREAKELGLSKYFTGKPCPKGHFAERDIAKSNCMECQKISNARYAKTEKFREICKSWEKKNRKSRSEKERIRRALPEVKERTLTLKREYRAKNIEKIRRQEVQYTNNRRARKRLSGGNVSQADIQNLLSKQGNKCAYCFIRLTNKYEADHIVPLALGGAHHPSNIQITCGPCNRSKHVKDPIVFAQSLGRLI